MKDKILNNFGLKLLSFVLAIVLWLVVANVEDPVATKQFRDVEVTIANESAIASLNKVYEVTDGATATFTVKGRRSILDDLTSKDFNVVADLSHLSVVNAVPVEISPKNDNFDIEIYKNNNTLTVSLEDEKESHLPVTIVTKGEVGEGYALGEEEVTPNIVDISGPKSLINKVKEARVTIDVSDAREDIKESHDIEYYNKDGELLDSTRISCAYKKAKATVQILRTKSIDVEVNTKGNVATGYSLESLNYEPQKITIAGEDDVLNSVDKIVINDVDISNLKKNKEYSFKVADYVPQNVVLKDPEEKIMVTAKIGQKSTRIMMLKAADIDIDNSLPMYEYHIDKDTNIIVQLKGYSDVINAITAQDLKPMINVESLSEGTRLCDVEVAEIEGVTVNISGKVKLEISKEK